MKQIARNIFLLALSSVTVVFVLVVPFAFSADRIRVGLSSFTPINAALWIAEEKGILKKCGIESEVVLIGGASAGGVSSLIAGDVQFLGGGGGGVISAALGGTDVIMIASIVNKGVQRVVARGDIKRPEDLLGKKIGITRLGERAVTMRGDQPLHDRIDFLQVPLGIANRVVDHGPNRWVIVR